MSFPNSGTSYSLLNARETSSISFATNYGDETVGGSARPIFQDDSSGPFWHCCQDDIPDICPYKCPTKGFVLTKTHCDGVGLGSHWLRSKGDFLEGCLRTTAGSLSSSPRSYDLSSVTKAVHLIRNPFDNIVSRFHLQRNNYMSDEEKILYDSSPAGFRAYCHDKQDIAKWRKQLNSSEADKLWAHLDGVPCHIDFLRYVIWHNNAFEVLSEINKPTFILHYESYATDWRATVSALLDFLDQAFVERNKYIPFVSDKVYREYFSTEEMMKVRAAFELFASEQTISHTKQYFESLPSAAEETLPQGDRGEGTLSGPGIVLLMSFPNSGTSYTLRAVRKASSISFATNYGEESRDHQLRSIPGTDSGPYWTCCQDTQPKICPFQCPNKGLVLTKTHCTGYQYDSIRSISHGSFLEGCFSTTAGMGRSGLYDIGRVERFVHLIRDPFDNIISRFHHMRNNLMTDEEKLRYDDSPTGFRAYCREKIDVVRWEKKMNPPSSLMSCSALFMAFPAMWTFSDIFFGTTTHLKWPQLTSLLLCFTTKAIRRTGTQPCRPYSTFSGRPLRRKEIIASHSNRARVIGTILLLMKK